MVVSFFCAADAVRRLHAKFPRLEYVTAQVLRGNNNDDDDDVDDNDDGDDYDNDTRLFAAKFLQRLDQATVVASAI